MATNSHTDTKRASALDSPSPPASNSPAHKWPDTKVDQIAIDKAFAELGENAPLNKLLARAQEIKEQLQLEARRVQ
jgi:hypothetical protein